jgi:hypothetical protein
MDNFHMVRANHGPSPKCIPFHAILGQAAPILPRLSYGNFEILISYAELWIDYEKKAGIG